MRFRDLADAASYLVPLGLLIWHGIQVEWPRPVILFFAFMTVFCIGLVHFGISLLSESPNGEER